MTRQRDHVRCSLSGSVLKLSYAPIRLRLAQVMHAMTGRAFTDPTADLRGAAAMVRRLVHQPASVFFHGDAAMLVGAALALALAAGWLLRLHTRPGRETPAPLPHYQGAPA
jgi:hypothetical protein